MAGLEASPGVVAWRDWRRRGSGCVAGGGGSTVATKGEDYPLRVVFQSFGYHLWVFGAGRGGLPNPTESTMRGEVSSGSRRDRSL